jgi:hypothetical protein
MGARPRLFLPDALIRRIVGVPVIASATDRGETAAIATITIPGMFQASVAYSSANPRRSSASAPGP